MARARGSRPQASERASTVAKRAVALEEELTRFERHCAELVGTPLDSHRNLERAERLLQELAEVEQRLNLRASELAGTLAAMRTRQEEAAAGVVAFAGTLVERRNGYLAILERFAEVVSDAGELDGELRGHTGSADAETVVRVAGKLREMAARCGAIEAEAGRDGYRDVERDATARRQQLEALAGKLGG